MVWTPAGVISGVVTPFDDADAVDWESLHRQLHRLADSGITAVLVNASMAEGGHLTAQERDEILTFAVREVGDRIPVVATVYGANTTEAAAEAGRAARAGARGLLVYPHPAFGGEPLDPDLPVAYFDALWSAAQLPMVAFRTPAALAPTLSAQSLLRLSELPGVVAVKDSTGDIGFYTHGPGTEFLAPDTPLRVLADFDPLLLPFLNAGVPGATVICSAADPERYVELFETRDQALFQRLLRFAQVIYEPPFRDFRARLKEALRHDGVLTTSRVRAPLLALSPQERERVIEALTVSRE